MWKPCLIATPLAVFSCLSGEVSAQIHAPPDAPLLTAVSPPVTTVAEAARGRTIRVTGEVIRVIDPGRFRVADATGSIGVDLPWAGSSLVEAGDRVVVEGIVDDELTFGLSRPSIHAGSLGLPSGAVIHFNRPEPGQSGSGQTSPGQTGPVEAGMSQADAPASEPSTVRTPIAGVRPGQTATISGRVVQILDIDEFRLEDESGSVRVYVGWRHRVPAVVGEVVTVVGSLDDDTWPVRPEFYADVMMLADGRAVRLGNTSPNSTTDTDTPAMTGAPRNETSNATAAAPLAAPRPATRTPIGSLRAYNKVLIGGVVERITDEDEFRIRDDSGSVRVYVGWRNRMPVRTGDRVEVYGIVDSEGPLGFFKEVYAYEITTPDGRVIDLQPDRGTARAGATAQAAPDIIVNPVGNVVTVQSVRRGQSVTLQGVVTRIRDTDEFVLSDDTGAIRIYIGWRNRMPVTLGERVTVTGFADDDVFPGMRPEIYADQIIRADGRAIVLTRGGYDD